MAHPPKGPAKKRTALTHEDKLLISRRLQLMTLEEISRLGKPGPGEVMFHGGTSISAAHDSTRWSEDLDFVSSPDFVERLFDLRERVGRSLKRRFEVEHPGSVLTVETKADAEHELGEVSRWVVRWEHPDVVGAVKIKTEFYLAQEEAIRRFRTRIAYPRILEVQASAALPAAEISTIWADKIVAIAMRPVVKHRDIYDLGYLSHDLRRLRLDEAELGELLMTSMSIYGRTPEDIAEGLEREMVREGVADRDAYLVDMRKWFSTSAYKAFVDDQHFDICFEAAQEQIEIGRRTLKHMLRHDGSDLEP